MGKRIFQQTPTAMNIGASGISSAARQMSATAWEQVLFVQGDGGPVTVTPGASSIEPHEKVGAVITIMGMSDSKPLTLLDDRATLGGLWLNGDAELEEFQSIDLLWCGDRYIELGRNF